MRKLVALLAFGSLFGLFAVLAIPAGAAPPPPPPPPCNPVSNGNGSATCTVHMQNQTMTGPVFPNVCPDGSVVPGGLLTTTVANGVFHLTINKAGDAWSTGTIEGTFVFVADGTGVMYTGHFAQWFGDSVNNQNQVHHATINFVGSSADGSRISLHVEFHFNTDASGGVHFFMMTHC
jgi:hypothetical protein